MSCGMGLIKYLLFIFNFVFTLCGLAFLIVGVMLHWKLTNFADGVQNIYFPSVTLIVIGAIIFLIAFFGCCGAIRESHCMIVTFASFLLTILIIQIAVAIYAFVVINNTKDLDVKPAYETIFKDYWKDVGSRTIVDTVQTEFKCCGMDSKNDYGTYLNGTIPWSCCGKPEGEECPRSMAYNKGCVGEVRNFIEYTAQVFGGIALGIAGVELIGIIFALCLANSIKHAERRGYRV